MDTWMGSLEETPASQRKKKRFASFIWPPERKQLCLSSGNVSLIRFQDNMSKSVMVLSLYIFAVHCVWLYIDIDRYRYRFWYRFQYWYRYRWCIWASMRVCLYICLYVCKWIGRFHSRSVWNKSFSSRNHLDLIHHVNEEKSDFFSEFR